MGSLHVLRPGLQSTVQDLGRWGHQDRGVPVAGAMDPFAHRAANALVGNRPGDATLEITLDGPDLEFDDARVVAVTGATFAVMVNQKIVPSGVPFAVEAGARLTFGRRVRGARAYLAVSGGFEAPLVFGSRSTHLPSRMGGWNGRALVAGDRLPLGAAAPGRKVRKTPNTPSTSASAAEHERVVRVLQGPQRDRFCDDAVDMLQSEPYVITNTSNRMGFRLRGPLIRRRDGADIISDATPLGSLQVPASGEPILLMADRQTTGGYPKLATVITADLEVVAQAAPGDALTFRVCSPAEALAALVAREQAIMTLEAAWS